MKTLHSGIVIIIVFLISSMAVPFTLAQTDLMFVKEKDIKWEKGTSPDGSATFYVSILHIDPETKATELIIKYDANTVIPWHWHSANETHTVISGTSFFEADGKTVELGPGGFNYIPAKMIHRAWTKDEPAMYFITVDGAWDINWVEKPSKAQR